MEKINFLYVVLTAFIPMIMGFLWYSNFLFGNAWMQAAGVSQEQLKSGNMAVIFIVSLILSVLIAMSLMSVTIHQMGVYSIFVGDPGLADPQSPTSLYLADFMEKYGRNYRTFKHGALHGALCGLFLVTPVISILALFERRSFKYIAIHAGYWILTLAIMGGVICAFA